MGKKGGFVFATLIVVLLVYTHAISADPKKGKDLFKTKKCMVCHDVEGDPGKFRPVGPGLKSVGKRFSREWLLKWLSPANIEIWKSNDANIRDIKARYKAAKKKEMTKSIMVKNFGARKGGKPPKIILKDEEKNHIIDYLLTL